MAKRKLPRPGDRVVVPFGYGEVEGEIMYVNTIFDPPEVQVEFELEFDVKMRNLYPIDMIRPAPVRSS